MSNHINIHGVKRVQVSPVCKGDSACWQTISITDTENNFTEITLFLPSGSTALPATVNSNTRRLEHA